MGFVRTNAAAAMLGVSPNTLRSWERRFGYPEPRRTAGGHRQFELTEIEALRSAFEETHNVSSAVSMARERGAGPATPARLRSAFGRFDEAEADRVLEESLAVRSVERTIEEVLLPGVEALVGGDGEQPGPKSPEFGFAWRWAGGWLAASRRAAPPATRDEGILIFDASGPDDLDALHAQALELVLRRGGLRTLVLSADLDPARVGRALHALEPRALVLTGRGASLDAFGRIVFSARRACGERVEIFDYRGALPETGASTVPRLGTRPLAAKERLIDALEGRERAADPRERQQLRAAAAAAVIAAS
jgi:hypothetical protein